MVNMEILNTEPEYTEDFTGMFTVTSGGPLFGTKGYTVDGKFHREDGPAVIYPDREEWWLNGEMVCMSYGVANCFEEVKL